MQEAKVRIEKVQVEPEEAYEYERKIYCCPVEGCAFECEDESFGSDKGEEKLKVHFGSVHATKETRTVNEVEFRRFDSVDNLKLFMAARNSEDHIGDGYFVGREEGPGWYGFTCEKEPCARGCCSKYVTYAYPTSHFEQEWETEQQKFSAALDQLKPLTIKE